MPSSLRRKGMRCGGLTPPPSRLGRRRKRQKAQGLAVHFLVRDALDLAGLNRKFDTATDSGLFHTLSDEDRPVFEKEPCIRPVPARDLLHALLQRPVAPRLRSEEDCGKGDTGRASRRAVDQLHPAATFESRTRARRALCLALIDNKKMMDGFSAVRLKAAKKPTYFLWSTREFLLCSVHLAGSRDRDTPGFFSRTLPLLFFPPAPASPAKAA